MPTSLQSPQRSPNKPPMQPNIANVVLGNLHVKPWYPSFYPEDLIGGRKAEWLYVCQWCFKYTPEIMKYSAHSKVCPMKDEPPPGETIYEKDGYAIHVLDGEENKIYAQNLSLFAKLFLDTKSVFFDVNSFLYYTLIQRRSDTDPHAGASGNSSGQVVGFFSKEKMSWDNNNVACILIFPPWQRKGLGQILMGASYELGKREGRFGGPERPLSALGRKGYLAFWCGEVCRWILKQSAKKTVTVKDISDGTWILPEDIVVALKEMEVTETRKTASGSLVVHKGKVRAWADKHRVSEHPVVDVDAFVEFEDEEDDDESDSE